MLNPLAYSRVSGDQYLVSATNLAADGLTGPVAFHPDSLASDVLTNLTPTSCHLNVPAATTRAIYAQVESPEGDGIAYLFTLEIDGDTDSGQAFTPIPAVPPAPTATRDCSASTFNLSASSLPATPFATTLELRRQTVGDTTWTTVHTWQLAPNVTSAPTLSDETLQPLTPYAYSLRRGSEGGFSDWSPNTIAKLESTTLTIALTAPSPIPPTLSNQGWFTFTLTDATPSPSQPLDLSITLGGMPVDTQATFTATNPCAATAIQPRNGTYRFSLDTRLYHQGNQTLTITARGGDGCLKRLTQTLHLQNNLSSASFYKDFLYPYASLPGYEWKGAHLSAENRALSPLMRDRYYVQSRVSADSEIAPGAQGWPDMQPVELQESQSYPAGPTPTARPASTQLRGAKETLVPTGSRVLWRTQWQNVESIVWYDTGYDQVVKIRPLGSSETDSQKFVLLCRDTDGSRAAVLLFDGTDLTPLLEQNSDILDACVVGDQIYTLPDPTHILVTDRDTGQLTVDLRLPEEPRPLRFLENVGGAPYAFATDATSTTITDLTFPSRTQKALIAHQLTHIGTDDPTHFALGFGTKLYALTPTVTTDPSPTTFTHPLTFVTPTIAALTNGSLWQKLDSGWQQVLTPSTPTYTHASLFAGANGTPRGIVASDSLQLVEQSGALWHTGRLLEIPTTVANSTNTTITAFTRWLKPFPEPTDEEELTESEPLPPDALIIGTTQPGLLGVWEQTDPTTVQGAILTSNLFLPTLDPIMAPKETLE